MHMVAAWWTYHIRMEITKNSFSDHIRKSLNKPWCRGEIELKHMSLVKRLEGARKVDSVQYCEEF